MHELAIAENLMEIVLEEGRRHKLRNIQAVRLQIGALAAVVPEALQFSFEMVSRGTIASGVLLEIETVPVVARCSGCNESFQVEGQIFLCPRCGEPALELISGRELALVGLQGEAGDDDGSD